MRVSHLSPLTVLLGPVLAEKEFGTVNSDLLGQHAEHERITRAALACQGAWKPDGSCFEPLSINQLAGQDGTFGAVGAPDVPQAFGAEAHCDDADFLAVKDYPQTRLEANSQLEACVDYLQTNFKDGIDDAKDLLDGNGKLKSFWYYYFGGSFWDTGCTFRPVAPLKTLTKGRAKCDVLQGFGIALHGVQDFYSHSNYADTASPPYNISNPPGLARTDITDLLDLRTTSPLRSFNIPYNLTTGCYAAGLEELFGAPAPTTSSCYNRVLHYSVNKDKGIIDPRTGTTTSPGTSRGKSSDNFQRAVRLAILDTKRQWSDFSAGLVARYGQAKGNKMICVITRDEPWKAC